MRGREWGVVMVGDERERRTAPFKLSHFTFHTL
jgi:hypothetical protein